MNFTALTCRVVSLIMWTSQSPLLPNLRTVLTWIGTFSSGWRSWSEVFPSTIQSFLFILPWCIQQTLVIFLNKSSNIKTKSWLVLPWFLRIFGFFLGSILPCFTGWSRKIYPMFQVKYLPNLMSKAFQIFSIKSLCIYDCSPKFLFSYCKYSESYD